MKAFQCEITVHGKFKEYVIGPFKSMRHAMRVRKYLKGPSTIRKI